MFLYERIQQKLDEKKLKQADIARATGKSTAAVTKWLKGDAIPKAENLKVIADLLGVSDEWLLHGKEDIYKTLGINKVGAWEDGSPLEGDEVEIRFYDGFELACGTGSIAEILQNDYKLVRVSARELRDKGISPENCVKVKATGDSMSTAIKDGDSVFLDLGRKIIKDGKIYAVCHGGLFKLKRLYNEPFGSIKVVSDNKAEYPEETLTKDDQKEQEFHVLGWVWKIESTESW